MRDVNMSPDKIWSRDRQLHLAQGPIILTLCSQEPSKQILVGSGAHISFFSFTGASFSLLGAKKDKFALKKYFSLILIQQVSK